MKTYHLDALIDAHTLPASALTIGNFDGVHRGHQAMLAKLRSIAKPLQLATAVMIFEPQPREYFATLNGMPDNAPARLSTLQEKQRLLAQNGVDMVIVARFDDAFRSLSASEFADMLLQRLGVQALVLGDDFRFGHDRTGDSTFLRNYGLPVTNLHTVTDAPASNTNNANNKMANETIDNRISSTRIRQCLQQGDLATANHLLGYDYGITGQVISGDKIGRTLAFPTANVALNRIKPALHGIYGVDVVVVDDDGNVIENGFYHNSEQSEQSEKNGIAGLRAHSLFGAANIGVRPAINKPHDWRLEVHFPNFGGDLYNKNLNVRFLHFLHAERNYTDLQALQAGIKNDVSELLKWRQQQG
ncbi:riboflavin biosynthesis protein RibF [Psychrobacter sp. I-STPA10]|uniref:riboflavin biosynthesis protein RibF n=1 Tax=Psychrobacter sp. I-STPA10 TaxID=2585769 RepID=UPI001E54AD07|nr:riboflavin biosynthesis protein RibF [Psychrobacter sp. I-STPA10]